MDSQDLSDELRNQEPLWSGIESADHGKLPDSIYDWMTG